MNQKIIAISWSHHQTPIEFRDKLALSRKEIQQSIRLTISNQNIEFGVLSTCNRIEFYALAEQSFHVKDAIKNLYNNILKRNILWNQSDPEIYMDLEAISHLCRVAAGMDSMVLGEMQILSQVIAAKQMLIQSQPTKNMLKKLFSDAINCADIIRNETPLYKGPESISELAVLRSKQTYNDIEKRKILIIGAGETAELAALHFKKFGVNQIIIANRSEKRGRLLAESISGVYISLKSLYKVLEQCDVIIIAIYSREKLFNINKLKNIMNIRKKKLLMFDLSTPRNVDSSAKNIHNVFLYDLDHLNDLSTNNIIKNKISLEKAEMIIQHHSYNVMEWFKYNDMLNRSVELIEEGD